eukprot:TRINITY_DN59884_c0_g1_i1.p1 TRINITY_DN59884_c0_g1~~TRINITY_DN59884_c0_g1_i1.p1  ORF type:complete len:458 (+),score=84.90 TRINITY_DN59884_c0_g1_i1:76-1374(+)
MALGSAMRGPCRIRSRPASVLPLLVAAAAGVVCVLPALSFMAPLLDNQASPQLRHAAGSTGSSLPSLANEAASTSSSKFLAGASMAAVAAAASLVSASSSGDKGRTGSNLAAAAEAAAPEASSPASAGDAEKAGPLAAFWKFLRPHTIRGTILGSSAMVTRVVLESGFYPDWSLLPKAVCGVLALLCGNGYIVGINQIYDVSIDVINKPFLPVAAKEISTGQAWVLCAVMAVLGSFLSLKLFGGLIGGLYCFGLFLGTIYSVPPLRLKQSAVAAALIIATVRGVLLNFGVYYASRNALGVPFSWSPPTIFMTIFGTIFALLIAVTKDLPDTEGDKQNNIETFSTRYGVDKVALAASTVLACNYAGALFWCFGPWRSYFRPQLFLTAHVILFAILIRGTRRLRADGHSTENLKRYYKLIWFLFYSEYFLFPFI